MYDSDDEKRDRIRSLNDNFRQSLDRNLGRFMITVAVGLLPEADRNLAIEAMRSYTFNCGYYDLHDFGGFEAAGKQFLFSIYYDDSTKFGYPSEDPSDTTMTTRILMLLLGDDKEDWHSTAYDI